MRSVFGFKSPADCFITASGVVAGGADLNVVCGTFMCIMVVDAVLYITVYTVLFLIHNYHSFSLIVIVFARTYQILQEIIVIERSGI